MFNIVAKMFRAALHSIEAPTKKKQPAHGVCLEVEALEERTVPTVTFHGGSLVSHAAVETVFYGSAWKNNPALNQLTGEINGFIQHVAGGSYMDMLSNAGYGVGRGSFSDGKILFSNPGDSLSDASIRQILQSSIDQGTLESPHGDRVYFVFAPPGTSIGTMLGYHNSWVGHDVQGYSAAIRYAVIGYPGGFNPSFPGLLTPFDGITKTSSHELVELVTDPDPNGIRGWFDDSYGKDGEIADIVASQIATWDGYIVQKVANSNDEAIAPTGAVDGIANPLANLSGQWFMNGAASTSIQQSGAALTFTNERSSTVSGGYLSHDIVAALGWNIAGRLISNQFGTRIIWSNDTVWQINRFNLHWYMPSGLATTVTAEGNHLLFTNEWGQQARGRLLGDRQVIADDWGGLVGTLEMAGGNVRIHWSNGTYWFQSYWSDHFLDGAWSYNGGSPMTQQNGRSLLFTNEWGSQSRGRILDGWHVIADDWGGLVGTLEVTANGVRIHWANGSIWSR